MTAKRPEAGTPGILKRSYLTALLASPLFAERSSAQASRPLPIGYIANGPERSIFEEKFEQGTNFQLVIDQRAIRALGVEIAPAVLDRADEVIE